MISRESLEQKSDAELEMIYREKKKELQQRAVKYQQFQDLLRHKLC